MKILQGSCVIIKVYQNSRLKVLIGIEEIIKILRLYIFTMKFKKILSRSTFDTLLILILCVKITLL